MAESSDKSPLVSVTKTQNSTSPIAQVSVNNPLPSLKSWFRKLIGNEAITIRIPLLTAILLVAFLGGGGITSLLRTKLPIINNLFPTPSLTPRSLGEVGWKDTAIKGTLRQTSNAPIRFYLLTSSDEAITLEVPQTLDLTTLTGKRILAIGTYNSKDKILKVTDVQDLEILSTTPIPIPTSTPTPTPIPTP